MLKVGLLCPVTSRTSSPSQATPVACTCSILFIRSSEGLHRMPVFISRFCFVVVASPVHRCEGQSCALFCFPSPGHECARRDTLVAPTDFSFCFMMATARAVMVVYGATSLRLPTFLAGMFVGSLKPYLLDSCECDFGSRLEQLLRRVSSIVASALMIGRRTVEVWSVPTTAVPSVLRSVGEISSFLVLARVAILLCVLGCWKRRCSLYHGFA